MHPTVAKLQHKLIVSCQARAGSPLYGPRFMAAMAKAAERGGAGGIRANGAEDIRAIRAVTQLPIIGIDKRLDPQGNVIITPDLESARRVVEAGADLVALSCAFYQRLNLPELHALIREIQAELGVPVMADCSTLEEGLWAAEAGADLLASTLSGYTPATQGLGQGPDLELVALLARQTSVPVVAEGRIWTPQEARAALEAGAYAVVVGTAITNPTEITRRFVEALP
ncbi:MULTISPECIES: N-acetylmannosamine-6-phosphate 2-epimerase [unclassified Meiothermus]|uniref:N-acetylmannosamine-6-phosphate 2-epimerase n=1 Tax=unclassified Meiothermus TaxID=370471 RepID=UPI000D7D0591|nr:MULTISPECIES: N-acetylmannosamine-6-phosphate 2-epimerase [unclassified Meiothermus]PZA06279.1 N-acetylmannosamine-6-phosphate 2-epimerase [Meiothermus sp. Pnk-1]RYM36393.1 N-acetylmannosamine-6-phosphate 2-epimerase [Meiothermus sp. PNK-Is4]